MGARTRITQSDPRVCALPDHHPHWIGWKEQSGKSGRQLYYLLLPTPDQPVYPLSLRFLLYKMGIANILCGVSIPKAGPELCPSTRLYSASLSGLSVAHSLDTKAASTLEESLAPLYSVLVYSVTVLRLPHGRPSTKHRGPDLRE